jgi:hypothetical protein
VPVDREHDLRYSIVRLAAATRALNDQQPESERFAQKAVQENEPYWGNESALGWDDCITKIGKMI